MGSVEEGGLGAGRTLLNKTARRSLIGLHQCLCACLCWAVTRYGHFNAGKVGIHQPYLDVPVQTKVDPQTIKNAYEGVLRDMKAYLREMNVPEQLADEMLKVPSTSVRYLSDEDQNQFGLVIEDPIEVEISDVEQARELGVARAELMRRKVLSMKECYARDMSSRSSYCYTTVMKTGRVPN
jgi:hypothetical protein